MRLYLQIFVLLLVTAITGIFFIEPHLAARHDTHTEQLNQLLYHREKIKTLNDSLVETTREYSTYTTRINNILTTYFDPNPFVENIPGNVGETVAFGDWAVARAIEAKWLKDISEMRDFFEHVIQIEERPNVVTQNASIIYSRQSFSQAGKITDTPMIGVRIVRDIILPREAQKKMLESTDDGEESR